MAKAAGKAKAEITLTFTKERTTKNTTRYAEDGDEPVVGTLYVKQTQVDKLGDPESLSVTITAA